MKKITQDSPHWDLHCAIYKQVVGEGFREPEATKEATRRTYVAVGAFAATNPPIRDDYDAEPDDEDDDPPKAPPRIAPKRSKKKSADVSALFAGATTPEQIASVATAAARNQRPTAVQALRAFENVNSIGSLSAAIVHAMKVSK